jgi:ankyrin repeat protein
MTVCADMKNPYIIPAIIIAAAILAGFWMLKPSSEPQFEPQEVIIVRPAAAPPSMSIHDAAESGNITAIKQHLKAGTDVNAWKDKYLQTPLQFAIIHRHKEIVELLIAEGADVNKGNLHRATPLHIAAGGRKETAELLIAAGANVNARMDGGGTPLDTAINFNHTETADLLRKNGGKTGEELKAEGK